MPTAEGSTYYLASRGGWHVQFVDLDGRRKTRKARPNTKRGAEATLRELLNARDNGTLHGRGMTIDTFAQEWLAIKRNAGCRPRTLDTYRERLRHYILPALGRVPINKLTPGHLDRLYGSLLNKRARRRAGTTLSPSTVKAVHDTLHALLTTARKRRLLTVIPTDLVDPPRVEKYEARTLTVDEARALLRGLRNYRHGALWTFILGTGCRFGEAAGLTWPCVDLDAGFARIEQQVSYERQPGRPLKYVLAPVKTDAGKRVVFLPTWVVDALKRQRELVGQLTADAAELWQPYADLVFPDDLGGLLHQNNVMQAWHVALAELGLPAMRQHDLRHSKGTLMADAGEDTTVIQRTLGHANHSITADLYIGNTPSALRAAADRFGKLLEGDADED